MVSAYLMGTKRFDQKSSLVESYNTTVPICGDNLDVKQRFQVIIKNMGFQTSDIGDLRMARTLENLNVQSFTDWYWPSVTSLLFLAFNFIWIFYHYYIFPKTPFASLAAYINQFSLISHLNKVLGFTALQLLALVYFSSCLASCLQLMNGSKYKRFPKFLDTLLKHRKQYGLYAFLFACCHSIVTIYIVNPGYLPDWFVNNKLTLIGELNILSGVLSFILFTLIALSSINAIGQSLSWSEWNLVQTKMGIACLVVGLSHAALMYSSTYMQRFEKNYDTLYLFTRVKLIATFFPALVVLLRTFFAYLPPLRWRIEAIRSGRCDAKKQQ